MSNLTNVHPFPKRGPEQQRRMDRQELGLGIERPVTPLRGAELYLSKSLLSPAEALDKALDEYRSIQLELAHKVKAFEIQMLVEHSTAQLRLEVQAYKALVAGVPESDIYALGEDMAEALESAMETVAGR